MLLPVPHTHIRSSIDNYLALIESTLAQPRHSPSLTDDVMVNKRGGGAADETDR